MKSLVSACVDDSSSHVLFMDNFFTSINLLEDLANDGLRATGTIRSNRICRAPLMSDKDLKKKERGTHDSRFHTEKEILLVKWRDNSSLTIATSHDAIHPRSDVRRRDKTGRIKVLQPRLVAAYNSSMGGVDQFDQHVSTYL